MASPSVGKRSHIVSSSGMVIHTPHWLSAGCGKLLPSPWGSLFRALGIETHCEQSIVASTVCSHAVPCYPTAYPPSSLRYRPMIDTHKTKLSTDAVPSINNRYNIKILIFNGRGNRQDEPPQRRSIAVRGLPRHHFENEAVRKNCTRAAISLQFPVLSRIHTSSSAEFERLEIINSSRKPRGINKL